ncbi:MAG: PmoA family protein [Planctomycetes bacterium]|nr:PmoA family protein [Planctomycetota bacterium]MBL7042127.1 PmoA family protein [Pirellulaceae bacterium]
MTGNMRWGFLTRCLLQMALACALAAGLSPVVCGAIDKLPQVEFRTATGSVIVTVDGQPIATYIYEDEKIPRPYFAHVKAPGGIQVTRNHPPVEGVDRTDHDTMHPGIWMAFGDLDGADIWRNKARVIQEEFVKKSTGGPGNGAFAVRRRYERADGTSICHEVCRLTLLVRPFGYLLQWDSTFSAGKEFYFGDQEEMGLGMRVTTPISVQKGGRMIDAAGRRNEREIWGNTADWCDYSGTVDGRHIGMTLMCHPGNFRPCWLHSRDYGFVAANPFGRRAFRKGKPSKVFVKPGEQFRLRFGVLIHADPEDQPPDLKAAYADYVQLTRSTDN